MTSRPPTVDNLLMATLLDARATVEDIQQLIDNGADVNKWSELSQSYPIIYAARFATPGQIQGIIRRLLEHKADPTVADKTGRTVSMCLEGRRDISQQQKSRLIRLVTKNEIEQLIDMILAIGGDDAISVFEHQNELLIDPTSRGIMTRPVQVGTGHVFDGPSIQDWIRTGKDTCPITRKPMRPPVENIFAKNIIIKALTEFLQQQYKEHFPHENVQQQAKKFNAMSLKQKAQHIQRLKSQKPDLTSQYQRLLRKTGMDEPTINRRVETFKKLPTATKQKRIQTLKQSI